MRNLISKLLEPLRDNKRSGRIEAEEEVFKAIYPKDGKFQIRWNQIVRIVAIKRDLVTTDLVCFQIYYDADVQRVVEINEEMEGFEDFARTLVARNMIESGWRQFVVKPAFEPNTTVLFEVSR